MTGAACEAVTLTLPEHKISPLVFIVVHIVLSFVSPYFMWVSCLLDFEFWLFLLFDCLVSFYCLLKHMNKNRSVNRSISLSVVVVRKDWIKNVFVYLWLNFIDAPRSSFTIFLNFEGQCNLEDPNFYPLDKICSTCYEYFSDLLEKETAQRRTEK